MMMKTKFSFVLAKTNSIIQPRHHRDAYSLAVLEKFINYRDREAPITVEICSFEIEFLRPLLDYVLQLLATSDVDWADDL